MSKEILAKFKQKKEVFSIWKKGQVPWQKYRDIVGVLRDAMRKAKAHVELSLARGVMDNKKNFFKYVSGKRKTREDVGLLLNGACALVTMDTEKESY